MARELDRLTPRRVAEITTPGRHSDGGCLYLSVQKTATGALSKHWTFLYNFKGKQREAGFGPLHVRSLAQARKKAREWRLALADGIDPIEAKRSTDAAEKAMKDRPSFGKCADDLVRSKRGEWRSTVHANQFERSLKTYCPPIWDTPVAEIDLAAVLSILTTLWATKPETASRVRSRIEAVLDYAKAHGLRNGENPARWNGHLKLILPKRPKLSRSHFSALPYREVPKFVADLRAIGSVPVMALEFLILTAARSGEAIGARWDEIDMSGRVWTIPAARMKSGREHRIPLSDRAIEILTHMAAIRQHDYVFPGALKGRPVGPHALRDRCAGFTVHGFRSSFRDWAGDQTLFPREIAEQCLAHATGDATEQAYRRQDALDRRRGLMDAWSAYCCQTSAANVIPIGRKA